MSEPKERPILFSAPMIRAILDGKKTMTRRLLREQPIDIIPCPNPNKPDGKTWVTLETRNPNHGRIIGCRFGVAGDRLWVRETFYPVRKDWVVYRADTDVPYNGKPWRPSIHLPRWASRITLEVTAVRVERLQDISNSDAKAEGVTYDGETYPNALYPHRETFRDLWDALNAKRGYGWASNPYVWVVSFKKLL